MAHVKNSFSTNGRGSGSAMGLARGLGWFGIGLGVAEMLAPRTLAEQLGMKGKSRCCGFTAPAKSPPGSAF